MSARHKLNVANLNGALIIATVVGIVSGSFAVFLATAVLLVAGALYDGGIRPRRRR